MSINMGIFTRSSLLYEEPRLGGVSHFLEHMIFRGSSKRSAKQITQEVDAIGGKINAYTARDYTCYHIKVLPDVFRKGLDILVDIFFNAKLSQVDCDLEKEIISEEIKMTEDTPDDYVFDILYQNAWQGHALSRPILGTQSSIKQINQESLRDYYANYFSKDDTVISIVGNIDEKVLMSELNKKIPMLTHTLKDVSKDMDPIHFPRVNIVNKEIEQAHLALSFPGFGQDDPKQYTMNVLSAVLGGSMSSRLFQQIREKKALAYSVFSHHSMLSQAGLLMIYAGVSPKNTKKAMKLILSECEKLTQKRISKKEYERVRSQLKGQLLLALEQPSSWLYILGRKGLFNQKLETIDEMLEHIMSVTAEDVQEMAQSVFLEKNMSLSMICPPVNTYCLANATGKTFSEYISK